MNRIAPALLVMLLAIPALAGDEKTKNAKTGSPATPAAEYQAIDREMQAARKAFLIAIRQATTEEDRDKVLADMFPAAEKYAPRFLDLADKNPKEYFAIDCLVYVVTEVLPGTDVKFRPRAMKLLLRDHLDSDKYAHICQNLPFGVEKQAEVLLRTLVEKSPHREMQGLACLALGQYLRNRDETARRLKARPEMAKFVQGLDKAYLKEIEEQGPARTAAEAEALFERAHKEFADLKLKYYGTVGAKAKAELYDLRFLSVAMPAPEIAGVDQDGQALKLSDYRGKVVLLDFWGQYSAGSRALFPLERAIVNDLKNKPFALIGVNTNRYPVALMKEMMAKEKLRWRSFADPGDGKETKFGPIGTAWNIQGSPTLYVLDHQGVIRYRWIGQPSESDLDQALESLLKEATNAKAGTQR